MTQEKQVVQSKKEITDEVGQPISPDRLRQLYSEREYLELCTFVRDLKAANWFKFCVSRAPYKFSYDPEMRFFQIGEMEEGEMPEIIFLGQGRIKDFYEVVNQTAADSWGFAVLSLHPKEKKISLDYKKEDF